MKMKSYHNYLVEEDVKDTFLRLSQESLSRYGYDEGSEGDALIECFLKGDCRRQEKLIFKSVSKCSKYFKNSGIWPDNKEKISKNMPLVFFFRWMVSTYSENKNDGFRFQYLNSELSGYGEHESELCSADDAVTLYRELYYYCIYGNEPIQKRPTYSDYCNFTVKPVEDTKTGVRKGREITIFLTLWNSYFQACMETYYKENEYEYGEEGNEG